MSRFNRFTLSAIAILAMMVAVPVGASMSTNAKTNPVISKGDRMTLQETITAICGSEAWPSQNPDCVEDIMQQNTLAQDIRHTTIGQKTGPNTTILFRTLSQD